jgi:hypothetical protein
MNWALNDDAAQQQATKGDYAVLSPEALGLSMTALSTVTCNGGKAVTQSWKP